MAWRKSRRKSKTTGKETKIEANARRVVPMRKKDYQHQNWQTGKRQIAVFFQTPSSEMLGGDRTVEIEASTKRFIGP
jgi:hypothetical protein